ncbi:prephenate dehydratase [Ascidiimonas aurantiaca]|uniref:prephenate dehydratase n=1 Tax=Ascidiimonas aurantiaca TaxID=1685432 RepID=UPI0030EE599A
MNKSTVAIQGIKGSFHHQVAQEYFTKDVPVKECLSFDGVITSLIDGEASRAVMALENSIAGSIIPNYARINENGLHIVGEHYIHIQHNLMALQGQAIEDIKEVHTHPMALLQCKEFFKKYPHIKLVEDVDTAETARRIHVKKMKGLAAVASIAASQMYALPILAAGIQTIQNNETRFVILQTKNHVLPPHQINKASLMFELDHKRGSLAAILNVMSDCKLNLTKIQSLPKIETPWKYSFFVDVTFFRYADFEKAKTIITIMADHFKVLGEYKKARI